MGKYQTKTVRIGITGRGKLNRLVGQGWEIVASHSHGMGGVQIVTLRRLKKRYRGPSDNHPASKVVS